MGRVALLEEAVANQIAAGEVVERPASVVKELVENALDAEAATVFVEVLDGGRELIRIVDDGIGMSREDASLAVQRHATSKIRTADDLQAIDTLGFRGEALPSIASVSRFSLVTRREEDVVATRVVIEGGATPTVRDESGPAGTRIEIRDLFYAVPARLKFLKRASTEVRHISALMTRFALGYPHVHFRLTHNQRKLLDVPRAPSLKQRIYQVLGADVVPHLLEIDGPVPVSVRGYITGPERTKGNRSGLHTFVNGRAVDDKVVLHGIQAAYGELLTRGRYPLGVLYVHLPSEDVDVNVHPAKAEVRFVRSGEVHQAIARAIRRALTDHIHATLPVAPAMGSHRPPVPAPSLPMANRVPAPAMRPTHRATPSPGEWRLKPSQVTAERQKELTFVKAPTALSSAPVMPTMPTPSRQPTLRFTGAAVTGQTTRGYIVCEDEGGLTMIHAANALAHVARRRLLADVEAGRELPSQSLLLPLNLELSGVSCARLERHASLLRRVGMVVEPFGGHTWQISAVPALAAQGEPSALLDMLLTALAPCDGDAGGRLALRAVVDVLAEHSGQTRAAKLSDGQVRQLLADLDDVGERHPGEARFFARLSWEELDNRFRRRG